MEALVFISQWKFQSMQIFYVEYLSPSLVDQPAGAQVTSENPQDTYMYLILEQYFFTTNSPLSGGKWIVTNITILKYHSVRWSNVNIFIIKYKSKL